MACGEALMKKLPGKSLLQTEPLSMSIMGCVHTDGGLWVCIHSISGIQVFCERR